MYSTKYYFLKKKSLIMFEMFIGVSFIPLN
jgi:hypothetical protein